VGKQRLEGLGVPIRRPVDYFCEQVKSDAHMAKVKDRLLVEEKKIEGFEKRLQRDSNRKFNKQVANVKKEEKSKTANKMVSDVTKVRKGYNKEGVEEGLKKILGEDGERKKGLKRVNMVCTVCSVLVQLLTHYDVELTSCVLIG
jgi:rRNA-processing protein EBP2